VRPHLTAWAVALALLASSLAASANTAPLLAAQAAPDPQPRRTCTPGSYGDDSADCLANSSWSQGSARPAASGGSSGATGPAQPVAYFQVLSTDAGGNTCVATGAWPLPAGSPVDTGAVYRLYTADAPYPPCPGGTGGPSVAAASFWQHVPLPTPQPSIAPGWAITGRNAFLETHGELHHVFRSDTPFGPLVVDAVGTYVVDWGDGETSWPYSVEGGPWPDGQISHVYINIGTYDVVVTERWTAVWHFGPNAGTLGELRTRGRIPGFPVRQIQAVVVPG